MTWICDYCGNSNDFWRNQCTYCGKHVKGFENRDGILYTPSVQIIKSADPLSLEDLVRAIKAVEDSDNRPLRSFRTPRDCSGFGA